MMDITLRRFFKFYTIILLTFIVEATSSNSNDTSHEHRQSRVTGRIVKLYSGTRPEPILCAGEGFQADPHDCAVFYRCMKSGSGKYTVFRFQCGPGTVYDPETEVCNHPRSTKRSECGGLSPPPATAVDRLNNNEIEGIQNEIPSPITSRPIRIESTTGAKPIFNTLNPWTASNSTTLAHTSTKRETPEVSTVFTSTFPWGSTLGYTNVDYSVKPGNLPQNTETKNKQYTMVSKVTSLPTTSTKPQSNSRDNRCFSDGFMGDSENCRKFYRCVANQRGSYTKFEFSCSETTVWDDDTQSCNHAWAVKRSRCGRSNQDNLITTNAEIPKKDSSTDKTIQQQLQISFGAKVTQTQTQISNGSSVIQNQTQINFGDRLNHNKDPQAKQNQTLISHGSAVSQTQTQIDYSDKGVQTQLQIDHSQQASQTQMQVHESTTSGSSSSTASFTSHVDTQDGRCERSGFMGDPNDCKKFYRCIDNGRGGYTKFEFLCGEGTVWDQSIEACNHAWAVKDCGGKGSAAITSTTQATISTSHSTQNYYPTTSNENHHTTSEHIDTEDNEDSGYGQQNQNPTTSSSTALSSSTWSSTTAGFTTPKSPSNGNCQSSGFMGDANDCKIFYRCVENGKGSFTKYEFKCGEGTVWDPDLEACNHAWAVKRCGGTVSPDFNNVVTTTEQQNTLSTAHTQSTIVTQAPTESAATQNDDYDTGYGSANNEDDVTSSTTTTTKKPQNEQPSVGTVCKFSGFMGDENDCKKFYRCVDNGNGGYTRYEFTCGEGTVWDSKIEACNHAWAVEKCGGSAVDHQESTTQAKPTTTHATIDSSSAEGDIITGSSTSLPSTASSTSTVTESVSISSNNCIKNGFMGDQKDCKKFYRCVDNGQGSFTKYEFSCGEGTVWDQEIEACNHAWAVKKCGGTAASSTSHQETTTQLHPTMSDEIDNGYPSNIDSGPEITTQSTTTISTTESSKEPSEGNSCISSGFIGDKNDCKIFYRCVDDGNGKYIRYEFSCGEGTLWDQNIEACNHAWAVKDCGKTGNNTAHPSSESPTQGTSATETEDQGYPQSTEKTSTSTVSSYPASEPGEACSQGGFIGDKRNCKKFYRCVDNGRGGFTKYEFTCGEGTYWNQEILACDHATSNKPCGEKESSSITQTSQPEHDEIYTEATMSSSSTEGYVNEQTQQPPASSGICTSAGFYGDQNDCKKFYRCVDNGKGNYTKYDFSCGDGTVWDQEIQACNHESSEKKCFASSPSTIQTTEKQPDMGNDISMTTASQIQHSTEKTDTSSTSTSSSFQCSSEGFFADPSNCKNFIRCVSNEKGGFTKYEFTCGEGTIWVQDIQGCDHDTGDTVCNTQSTSKPSTTEGHHQTTENNEVVTSTSQPQTIDKQEDEYDNGNSNKPSQPDSDDCSSEGFYGNKNDCRQFYRCVDNGQEGYTKYDFTCGDGTAWDSEIQSCNHIDQVKTCHGVSETQPVMHDEDNSPSTESSGTTSSSSTSSSTTSSSSTSFGTTTSSATSSSTTSSSTTTSGSNNQDTTTGNKDICDSEGYFGNTQDCKKFYRCVDNGKGGYTKYDFDCGDGTIWDQDVTTCNHPQDVVNPSCNQNQDGSNGMVESTTITASSSSTGETSSTSESSPSSDSSLTSSSSQSTTESTQGSSNCSQEDTSKKPTNQNITCDKAGYFANPNDCKKFYRCVDWDGDGKRFSVYHFDCGEGTIWDPAVETCNHEESVYPPRDCSGSQSQSESQPVTEGTTTTQQETSTQESTSTQTTSTTKSSTEQTTESTTFEPTTSQQLTSSEKTTTQQATTSEQTTTQSTTTEQTTQQPTTFEQTTQQSTTSEKTTQQSTTSELTTQQPTSDQTSTQASTTSEKTTTQQSSTSEQTTTQQSTTSEKTTTEQSTISEQTTTQQSTSSEQTTQEPTTSEQTTQESTTSEQTTQASTTTEQITTSEKPTTEQSTTSESTTEQSTTSESTTEQSPATNESSTTEQSTTQQSTTTEQSAQSTTEDSTTSEGATTEQSTTEQSTTEQMNGSSSTESGTDESTAEKKCPETEENQSLFVCPTSFKRHPKYCNLFYQCDEDDDTHDVKIAVFTCPNNTIYDESQTRCVEESKTDKKCDGKIAQKRRFKRLDKHYKEPLVATKDSHACSSAGYYSFEKDSECSPAFLKCKTDKTNKLRGLVYQCPSGFLYWSISKRCEPMNRVRDCKRSQNNWSGRWEIPVERRNVAPS